MTLGNARYGLLPGPIPGLLHWTGQVGNMKERRTRTMKRLLIEELERRTMLNGNPIAMASTGLTNNSYEDFYKAQVGTEIGGPAGVGMLSTTSQGSGFITGLFANPLNTGPVRSDALNIDSGVGQLTITTGANTPGISSFATPTAGPSRAGGTGNAAFGSATGSIQVNTSAVDQAINELSLELPDLTLNKSRKAEPAQRFESDKPITERSVVYHDSSTEQVREIARQHQ